MSRYHSHYLSLDVLREPWSQASPRGMLGIPKAALSHALSHALNQVSNPSSFISRESVLTLHLVPAMRLGITDFHSRSMRMCGGSHTVSTAEE